MRGIAILATVAAAALTTGCPTPKRVSIEIVCQATVLDAAGATVATLEDTVTVEVPTTTPTGQATADSVGGDPRPCRTSSRVNGYVVLNGTDSATGNPTQ